MRTPQLRSSAALFALFALLLRGLMPVGWMPNPAGAHSGIPLIICTLDGLHRIDPAQKSPASHHNIQVCPFAAAAHFAPPQPVFAVLPQFHVALREEQPLERLAVTGFKLERVNGPRAPPAIA